MLLNESYLLKSLDVLEKVEVGHKLSVSFGILKIDSNPNRIIRWLAGDGKYISLEYITQVINSSIFLHLPINPNVIVSLENLKMTYHKSERMVSRLTSLQELIEKRNNFNELN